MYLQYFSGPVLYTRIYSAARSRFIGARRFDDRSRVWGSHWNDATSAPVGQQRASGRGHEQTMGGATRGHLRSRRETTSGRGTQRAARGALEWKHEQQAAARRILRVARAHEKRREKVARKP